MKVGNIVDEIDEILFYRERNEKKQMTMINTNDGNLDLENTARFHNINND